MKINNSEQVKVNRSPAKKRSKNFYLITYNYIKTFNKIPKYQKLGLKSKQSLNWYVKSLKRNNFIEKIGYGTWKCIKEYNYSSLKKSKFFLIDKSDRSPAKKIQKKQVRGHGFIFYLKIPKLKNWKKRERYLYQKNINFKKIPYGQTITLKDRKIKLFDNSVIIYDRFSYISDLAKNTKSQAIYKFLEIVKSLERLLKADLSQNKRYKFKVMREHYGLIKNALARQYDRENKKLYCYCDKGLWFIIDNSYNLHEAETVLLDQAISDNEGIQKFFNEMKETNYEVTPKFMLNAIGNNTKTITLVLNNQVEFAKNLKAHVYWVKKGTKIFQKFEKKLDKL